MTLALLFSGCRALPARARRQVLGHGSRWARRPRAAVPFSATGHVLARDPSIQPHTTQTINYKQQQSKSARKRLCRAPSLQPQIPPQPKCRLSAPSSARRGTDNCATRSGSVRGCKPVAPCWAMSKAGSAPGSGSAIPPDLRPWKEARGKGWTTSHGALLRLSPRRSQCWQDARSGKVALQQ